MSILEVPNEENAIMIPAYSDGLTKLFYNKTDKDVAGYELEDFGEKKSLRIFNPDANPYFENPWMLISAGICYDKKDTRKKIGAEKAKVFIDSGGFQLAMGTVNPKKFDDKVALEWSEQNGDIFPILDRPVRGIGKTFKNYEECLTKTIGSARYYTENRTRKDAVVLNVLQGGTFEEMEKWYQSVKDFKFEGWGIGGTAGSPQKVLTALLVLINNREFENERKLVHIFGVTSSSAMVFLRWMQVCLNKQKINVQLTYDSTYWNRTTVFGGYFMTPRWKGDPGMQQISVTNRQLVPDKNGDIEIDGEMYRGIPQDYTNMSKEFKLPCVLDCPVCSDLKDTYKFYNNYNEKTGSLQMHKFNIAMAFHNLYMQMVWDEQVNKFFHFQNGKLEDVGALECEKGVQNLVREVVGEKVYAQLKEIEDTINNPKKSSNVAKLYHGFKHKVDKTSKAPSLMEIG